MEFIKEENKYDYSFKILLIGSENIGKSAFYQRIKFINNYDEFLDTQKKYIRSIGIDYQLIYIQYLKKFLN